MSTEVVVGGLGECRTASTAGGGTALTTTAGFIKLPKGMTTITLTPRNFSTAVVVKYQLNPWLTILKTADLFATAPTDYSNAGQDFNNAAAGVVLSSLDTLANLDAVLVGSALPFRGIRCVANAANGNASVLSGAYRKTDDTWANASITDGTTSGGATFAQTGNITFTVPTDWKFEKLVNIYTTVPYSQVTTTPMYWLRLVVSAALDSSTTLDTMCAMNRDTAQYPELILGEVFEEHVLHGTYGGIGCVEALTDAGTANLIVKCWTARDGKF